MRGRFRLAIVASLVALGLASGCPAADEFNLEIFGNEACVGAEVLVDSHVRGVMEPVPGEKEGRAEGAHFSLWLRNGSHSIELRREGFAPVVQEIVVPQASEHYLVFEMREVDATGAAR